MREALENQIDFLLSAALKRCGNLEDAQDLTQETLLSALVFLSKGGTMREPRGWLMTVLTRKYYDSLRRKMHRPLVSIGENFELIDSRSELDEIARSEEAEVIRREIACLSAIYRNVVARYYMKGESVGQIASSLGIPEGTVKSRLSAGRQRMKEGINKMESYQRQSYEPIRSDPYYTPSYDVFDTDYLKLLYLIHSKTDQYQTPLFQHRTERRGRRSLRCCIKHFACLLYKWLHKCYRHLYLIVMKGYCRIHLSASNILLRTQLNLELFC